MATVEMRGGVLTMTPYVFRTADDRQRVAADLGRLVVPERRDRPDGKQIELAFVRLPSTAERPGPPIVYLAGGPGDSGIDEGRHPRAFDWFTAWRAAGDVILLDQRGVGLSHPRLDSVERWDLPLDRPLERETFIEAAREKARRRVAFWRERGVDLFGYTSVESADDIDAVRAALGAEQVSLYGASYGSHLAMATIRRHGPRIARAVIALPEGPDHTYKLPSNVQRVMENIDRLVRADAAVSKVVPDFLGLVREVLARLKREPATAVVPDPDGGTPAAVTVGRFDLALFTANSLGDIETIRRLPKLYHAMAGGDFSWVAGRTLGLRRGWTGEAMGNVMDCASGASPERLARIRREGPATLLGDVINLPFPDQCDAWGSPDLGEAFRGPLRSDVPALFISGTLDGRTPPSNVAELQPGFPNGHHVLVENMAHGGSDLPELRRIEVAFLRGEPVTVDRLTAPFAFEPVA